MSENSKTIIDSYMDELGIVPYKDYDSLFKKCESISGLGPVQQIVKIMNDRGNGQVNQNKTLYNKKNTNYAFALTYTGGIDYYYLERLFEWILNNEQYFGERILEVGCDIGLVSCFLGRVFPEKTILAIDKFDKSIAVAQKLADKLGVKNVEFKRADVAKVVGQFDTVFSSRTMHENIGSTHLDMSFSLRDIGERHKQLAVKYGEILTKLVDADGQLVSVERCEIDPSYLGWLWALNEQGFSLIEDTYAGMKVPEVDKLSEFQAGVFRKQEQSPTNEEILQFFSELACKASNIADIKGNWGTAKNWASLVALDECAGKLVEGYVSYHPKNAFPQARYAVYENRYDLDSSLVYQYVSQLGVRVTNNTFASYKNDNVDGVRDSARRDIGNGFIVYRLHKENGKEEKGERVKATELTNPLLYKRKP